MLCVELYLVNIVNVEIVVLHRSESKEYALKQIEGTGISMSACREIAVSMPSTGLGNLRCTSNCFIFHKLIKIYQKMKLIYKELFPMRKVVDIL